MWFCIPKTAGIEQGDGNIAFGHRQSARRKRGAHSRHQQTLKVAFANLFWSLRFFFSLSPIPFPKFFFFLFKKSLKYFLLDDDAGDESNFKPTTSFCFLIRLFHYWIFFPPKKKEIFWPLMFSPPTAPIFPPTPIINKGMSFLIKKKRKN